MTGEWPPCNVIHIVVNIECAVISVVTILFVFLLLGIIVEAFVIILLKF